MPYVWNSESIIDNCMKFSADMFEVKILENQQA
jgi:hypothetical protein